MLVGLKGEWNERRGGTNVEFCSVDLRLTHGAKNALSKNQDLRRRRRIEREKSAFFVTLVVCSWQFSAPPIHFLADHLLPLIILIKAAAQSQMFVWLWRVARAQTSQWRISFFLLFTVCRMVSLRFTSPARRTEWKWWSCCLNMERLSRQSLRYCTRLDLIYCFLLDPTFQHQKWFL